MIFLGQDLLTIELETGYDLSNTSSVSILYKKPDGTQGEWAAVVSDTSKVSHSVQSGDLAGDQGIWIFQAKIIEDGRIGYGNFVYEDVKLPITPA